MQEDHHVIVLPMYCTKMAKNRRQPIKSAFLQYCNVNEGGEDAGRYFSVDAAHHFFLTMESDICLTT
jgi:hypothetical protein